MADRWAGFRARAPVTDVGMNIEAAAVQDRLGRRTMSGFHAAYSVGGLVGAGLGGIAAPDQSRRLFIEWTTDL